MEESEIEGETTLIVADDGAGAGLQLPPRALSNNEEAVSLRQAGDRPSLRRSEDSEDVAPSPAASPFRSLAKRVSLLSPVRRVSQLASASPRLSRTASAVTPKASEALARFRRAVRNVQGSHTTAKRLRALAFARQVRSTVQEDDQLGPPPEREEPSSTRDVIADFMSSKPMEILFMFVTLFCLYADDMRTCLFLKESDPLFYVLTTMSLIVFSVELTIQSIVQEGYKWSFFFWMDVVALISIVPDIDWLMSPLYSLFTKGDETLSGNGSTFAQLLRMVRLVRLLRVVNLAKMCAREKKTALDDEEPHPNAKDDSSMSEVDTTTKKEREASSREKAVAASRLGKIFAEQTMRRVVIGVIFIQIVGNFLSETNIDGGPQSGLEQLFWFGRSQCSPVEQFINKADNNQPLQCEPSSLFAWTDSGGWEFMLFSYTQISRSDDAGLELSKPVLYLEVPTFHNPVATVAGLPFRNYTSGEILLQAAAGAVAKLRVTADVEGTTVPVEVVSGVLLEDASYPVVDPYMITDISTAEETTVQLLVNHTFTDGDMISITGVTGEDDKWGNALNINHTIRGAEGDLITLVGVNTTGLGVGMWAGAMAYRIDSGFTPSSVVIDTTVVPGRIQAVSELQTTWCADTLKTSETTYPFNGPEEGLMRPSCPEDHCCWKAHPQCGKTIDDTDCPWRAIETELVTFSPQYCHAADSICSGLEATARILVRRDVQDQAGYNMVRTTLIIVLLSIGAVKLSSDTQKLVIEPIERMVSLVKQLAENPLSTDLQARAAEEAEEQGKHAEGEDVEDKKKDEADGGKEAAGEGGGDGELQIGVLESALMRIGSLLHIGLGDSGAHILARNLMKTKPSTIGVEIMIPGHKVTAVFGFIEIRDFCDVSECLMEELPVYMNKISRIVHGVAHEWDGATNKNMGGAFLVVWKVKDSKEQKKMLRSEQGLAASNKMRVLADKSLVCCAKVIAELRRSADNLAYAKHPKISARFGPAYRTALGFGLHPGWAIEGAIGSSYKIDATYVSPSVAYAWSVQRITKLYGVPILLSEEMFQLLSTNAKERCRAIDRVKLSIRPAPTYLYSFDVPNHSGRELACPEGHLVGQAIPPGEMTIEQLVTKGVEWLFLMEQDVIVLREAVTTEALSIWRRGFDLYESGEWGRSAEHFDRMAELMGGSDGPADTLIEFMDRHHRVKPLDWKGHRDIEVTLFDQPSTVVDHQNLGPLGR
mmetsp:Transcript_10709/g.23223  ORF Transcript_10709/g.23223 Transcript_10709/m.23223 type:complete len:1219 (-) Transcript_10709:40-3696(-)